MRRIKIRIHSGQRIWAPAISTKHPLLFVTPFRINKEFSHTGRARFSEAEWTITHKPTGCAVGQMLTREDAVRLANLFADSCIPWEKLRSAKSAKKYADLRMKVLKKFYAGDRGKP